MARFLAQIRVNELRTHMLDCSSPTPSVETLLHAFLPHKYVDHTHPDAILTLVDQPEEIAVRIIKEIYGDTFGMQANEPVTGATGCII